MHRQVRYVFISAYGIAKQGKELNKENITRRIIKIIMPFLFVYILAAIYTIINGNWSSIYGNNWQSTVYFVFLDACGLANLFGTPTLNGTWWYMTLALFLPIIIMATIKLHEKIGTIGVVLLGIFVPACFGVPETDLFRWWILTMVMGIVLARDNFYEKFLNYNIVCKIVICFVAILLICPLSYIRYGIGGYWIIDAILVFFLSFLAIIIEKLPIINYIFEKLGNNPFNMFLTHSFIFYYYFKTFIYSWRYPALILFSIIDYGLYFSYVC